MLAPDDRALLLDGLRPPAGSRLERAVGTTFTLDLATALTIPLAFAGHALSTTPDPIAVMEALLSLAGKLRRVEWELPEGVREARFWPLGLPGMKRPNLDELFRGYRHLVISPFVTAGGLDAVLRPVSSVTDATVVSRPEELDRLNRGALDGRKVFVINPLAGLDSEPDEPAPSPNGAAPFGALHAKVILVEVNRRARLFLRSANATHAAFGGNVAMLIER